MAMRMLLVMMGASARLNSIPMRCWPPPAPIKTHPLVAKAPVPHYPIANTGQAYCYSQSMRVKGEIAQAVIAPQSRPSAAARDFLRSGRFAFSTSHPRSMKIAIYYFNFHELFAPQPESPLARILSFMS
jgi:hypothetical protein